MDKIIELFEVPLYFIRENLNGWFIVFIFCVIIYFVILRTYYKNKERFYDKNEELLKENKTKTKKGDDDADNTDNTDNTDNADNTDNNTDEEPSKTKTMKSRDKLINNNNKTNNKPNVNPIDNKKKIKNPSSKKQKSKSLSRLSVIEGFEPISTQYLSSIINNSDTSDIADTTDTTLSQDTILLQSLSQSLTATTLFDNLSLSSEQIILCKTKYNQVIKTCIFDLQKLLKLKKNNEYLDTKKQFDVILARGIDNIINYLSNTIKSANILTRTSIRTEVNNGLTSTLELLIDKTSNNLTNQMNSLAAMNSTTIDYKTMLSGINDTRAQIEEYIEITKLVTNNGSNLSNFNKEINDTLDKSFILPIYERNFDRINQLVKSDFNDNEGNLANKYGQAYSNFLNEKKQEELDINPLRLASKIESGIVGMLTNLVGGGDGSGGGRDTIEQINPLSNPSSNLSSNPIPEQQYNIINNSNSNNLNKDANIYKDKGNLGNYLIDKKTQAQVLESFEVSPTSSSSNSKNNSNNKNKESINILASLASGDFIKYIMDYVNDKLSIFYKYYNNKFGSGDNNTYDKNGKKTNNDTTFNLEENMIPAGFMFFVLSMLIYFIDTTS